MQLTVPSPSGQTLAGFSSAAACSGPAHSIIPYTYRIPSQLLIECEQRQKIPILMGKQIFLVFTMIYFARVCALKKIIAGNEQLNAREEEVV